MLSALLKFCLPLSVAGTGVATALGVSSSNFVKNISFISSSVTEPTLKTQEQEQIETSTEASKEVSLPLIEIETPSHSLEASIGAPEHFDSGREEGQPLEAELKALEAEKLLPIESALPSLDKEDPASPLIVEEESTGNCEIIEPVKDVFGSISENFSDYYTVSCENRGNQELESNWIGLFLKSFFTNQESISINKKFDLYVTVSGMGIEEGDSDMSDQVPEGDEDLPFGITFSSSKFQNKELKGRWDYGSVGDESGATVNLSSFSNGEKIYLLFP